MEIHFPSAFLLIELQYWFKEFKDKLFPKGFKEEGTSRQRSGKGEKDSHSKNRGGKKQTNNQALIP